MKFFGGSYQNNNNNNNNNNNKLMILREKMRCHKVRQILRYHMPHRILFPEKFAHHMLLLFCRFKDSVIRSSAIVSKQPTRARSPECCKHKENEV